MEVVPTENYIRGRDETRKRLLFEKFMSLLTFQFNGNGRILLKQKLR